MKLTKQKLYDMILEVEYESRKTPLKKDGEKFYHDARKHAGERVWVHTERTMRNNGYNGMIGVYKTGSTDNKTGQPYFKTNAIALSDCVFKVSGGKTHEKYAETGKRTLSGGCTGTVVDAPEQDYNSHDEYGPSEQFGTPITYHPKVGYFYSTKDSEQKPLIGANLVLFTASEDGQWTMTAVGLKYDTTN